MLWFRVFPNWINYLTNGRVDPRSEVNCGLFRFLQFTTTHASTGFLVIMSVEKCFALYYPIKTKLMFTVKNAILVSLVNLCVWITYNLQWIFTMERVDGRRGPTCDIVNALEFFKQNYRMINIIVSIFVPVSLMVVCNSAIVILLYFKRSKSLSTVGSMSADTSNVAKQATIMLLSVTCVFILLKLPISTYLYIVGNAIRKDPIVIAVVANLAYLNSAINTILYMFSGSKYREEALGMLPCRKNRGPSSGTETISKASGTNRNKSKSQTILSELRDQSISA